MDMSTTSSIIIIELAVLGGIIGLSVLFLLRRDRWVQTGTVTTGVVVDIRCVVTTHTRDHARTGASCCVFIAERYPAWKPASKVLKRQSSLPPFWHGLFYQRRLRS